MERPNDNSENQFPASMLQGRMKTGFKQAASGALAGTLAAFTMTQFVTLWHSATGWKRKDGVFGLDPEADLNAAQGLWRSLFGKSLTEADALKVALALHYAHGAAAGAGYALLVNKSPIFQSGFGTLYGAALWLAGGEVAITLMRLSDPRSKTKSSHMMALAAHLLYGSVTEFGRRAFIKVLGEETGSPVK